MISMTSDHLRLSRCSMRLRGHDYSKPGAYLVTVCVQDRKCLFGCIRDRQMRANAAGSMIQETWAQLPNRFVYAALDAFVLMPNHIHGIILLTDDRRGDERGIRRGESCIRPQKPKQSLVDGHEDRLDTNGRPRGTLPGSLGRIMQAFTSITTHEYIVGVKRFGWPSFAGKLWQRNYHDHIIRNEKDLHRIRQYIVDNPACWAEDKNNPHNWAKDQAAIVTARISIA